MKASFELIEVGGFKASIEGMRYPTKSNHKSDSHFSCLNDGGMFIGPKDIKLATGLIKKGSVHCKFRRGCKAWFRINMPLAIWSELDTYSVGCDMISSESTMYTLIKECANVNEDMFVDGTSQSTINAFRDYVDELTEKYGSRKDIPIDIVKYALPSGWMQKRNRGFSYECLASMYRDRLDHRMPQWQIICKSISELPYFKELILGEE